MLIPIRVQTFTKPGPMEDKSVLNSKYAPIHFHVQFLLVANLHKVKRTDNIFRMFQDSVYKLLAISAP